MPQTAELATRVVLAAALSQLSVRMIAIGLNKLYRWYRDLPDSGVRTRFLDFTTGLQLLFAAWIMTLLRAVVPTTYDEEAVRLLGQVSMTLLLLLPYLLFIPQLDRNQPSSDAYTKTMRIKALASLPAFVFYVSIIHSLYQS